METNERNTEVLNDLIEINNDRVEGYQKAASETAGDDGDLRTLFTKMADESRGYAEELRSHVRSEGEAPAEGTTNRGKVYRVWMDIKAAITGKNRKAILSSCEFGEDAAQRAYKTALDDDQLSGNVRTIISEQRTKLRASHDRIRNMRDAE
ncbi:MAG: PA2169 family four-helix-bundle protein [Chitinophagaceae bacterium]